MRKALLLAIPLLVLACDREPVAPAAEGGISANYMNNPDNGNPRIWRYETSFFMAWNDNGLRVTHRTDPTSAYGDCFEFAPPGAAEWNERLFGPPELSSRWMANVQAEVWITVRDLTQPGTCAGNLLIAEGWGRLLYNDNDEFAGANLDRKNANAWSYRATGDLVTPDGRTLRYSGHAHFTWDRGDNVIHGENYQIILR
jgi:hypothetical protein